jgi:hypothetical protein
LRWNNIPCVFHNLNPRPFIIILGRSEINKHWPSILRIFLEIRQIVIKPVNVYRPATYSMG